MNKSQLIAAIAQKNATSKTAAAKSLKAVLESIIDELSIGGSIAIAGFGVFLVKQRASRKGRNPGTGLKLIIPARKDPVFKAGRTFKQKVA